MSEGWRDLLRGVDLVDPPADVRRRAEQRRSQPGAGSTPRTGSARAGRIALALVGAVAMVGGLALAAHSRSDGGHQQPSHTAPHGGRTITDQGVSLRLPAGWQGAALPGRLQIRNSTRGRWGAPGAGQVFAVIDERSRSFAASDGLPYPRLLGSLAPYPGQFSTHQLAGGDWSSADLFHRNGRYFELGVIYGDAHPTTALIMQLDRVLATLVIRPVTAPPATLQPPGFAAAAGWRTGQSPATQAQPQGDQLCAWASTIRYRDANPCPIPTSTISALTAGGMVISVDIHRDFNPPLRPRLAQKLVVPATITVQGEGGYRSADITGNNAQYTIEIAVYIGRNQRFTAAMRSQAQQELDRLRLPNWPALAPSPTPADGTTTAMLSALAEAQAKSAGNIHPQYAAYVSTTHLAAARVSSGDIVDTNDAVWLVELIGPFPHYQRFSVPAGVNAAMHCQAISLIVQQATSQILDAGCGPAFDIAKLGHPRMLTVAEPR